MGSTHREPRRSKRLRRAFALPLVVMLALAGTILLSVMLDRQSGQTLGLARQTASAREFHFARGLREIFQSWAGAQLRGAGRQSPLRNALDLDGRVGEITLVDGTHITMYAFEAQGTPRSDFTGLTRQEREDARAILEAIGPIPPNRRARETREFGPLPVSVFSAPIETLSAIVEHVTAGVHASDILEALMALRDDPQTTNSGLSKPEITQHLEDEQSDELQRMLTLTPRLWEVVLDAQFGPEFAATPTKGRYWGLFLLPDGRASNMYGNRIQVLTWHYVDFGPQGDSRSVAQWRAVRDEP
ncbi:MAG: hypothetical protein IT435_06540 [Phycisphaerales bacterium]|nr:hypothetical protein [Phycisphaerales bacterium]